MEATVAAFAPRLYWQVEIAGYLALGFEYVDGRAADYGPGSPDLEPVAGLVQGLQQIACPPTVRLQVERRWAAVAEDVTAMGGPIWSTGPSSLVEPPGSNSGC